MKLRLLKYAVASLGVMLLLQANMCITPAMIVRPGDRTASFDCPSGPSIAAIFRNDSDPASVDLLRGKVSLHATQAIAASGARYTGANGLQFWNKGRDALVDWPGEPSMTCTTS